MNTLRDVLAETLAAEGAIIEPIEPDGLEVLAPPHIQEALTIPEWSRLGFGPELPEEARRVSLESDWVERLERLLENRGRCLSLSLEHPLPKPRDLQALAQQEMILENSACRLAEEEMAKTSYLLLTFRITAVSDEKSEDLLHLCINEANGASADSLVEPLLACLRAGRGIDATGSEDRELPGPWPARRVHALASRALPARIRVELSPFLSGMERRMARDLERLHTYHTDLRSEVATRLREKMRKSESVEIREEIRKREESRLEAIEREYHAKVADLQRKYAMTVEVRFTQALRVAMPVIRVSLTILRRKGSRNYPLDWNPLARAFDSVPCEACWLSPKRHASQNHALRRTLLACDDQLHLVCASCMSPCPSCGKAFCRACHPKQCPKCRKNFVGR